MSGGNPGDTDGSDWAHAGEAVKNRRLLKGLTQETAAGRATAQGLKISALTWRKIEKAQEPPYQESSIIAVCWVLGWNPDGYERLLRGEEPIESPPRDDLFADDVGPYRPAPPDAMRFGHDGTEGWPAWLEDWLKGEISSIRDELVAVSRRVEELADELLRRPRE